MNKQEKKNAFLVEEKNYSNIVYRRLRDIPGYSEEAIKINYFSILNLKAILMIEVTHL